MIAVLLVAALACNGASTQLELNVCSAQAAKVAAADERAAYDAARDRFASTPVRLRALAASEQLWQRARDAACAFDAQLVAGGSIQPLVEANCAEHAARARIADIGRLLPARTSTSAIASPASAREHTRVYGLLELLVTPGERALLARSERAWLRYRRSACSYARAECATALTQARTQQLKDSWLADPFW